MTCLELVFIIATTGRIFLLPDIKELEKKNAVKMKISL
jgi:hypothetical protein